MAYMSNNTVTLNSITPEQTETLRLFNRARELPVHLSSHNNLAMQQAYLSVSQNTWYVYVQHLQEALRTQHTDESLRRYLAKLHDGELTQSSQSMMARIFVTKYNELKDKVRYDYDNFFPYKVSHCNEYSLVFRKLEEMELIKYVLTFNR